MPKNQEKTSKVKAIRYWLSVIVIGVVLGGSIQFARAWTNPTIAPPGGNVAGPITTSAIAQYKAGALGIGGLVKAYLGIDVGQYDASGTLTGQNRITNVATPINGKDAVNKDYVDAAVGSATFDMLHGWWAWHHIAVYNTVANNQNPAILAGTQADAFCSCSGYGSAKSFTETEYAPYSDRPVFLLGDAVGSTGINPDKCGVWKQAAIDRPNKIFKSIICQ